MQKNVPANSRERFLFPEIKKGTSEKKNTETPFSLENESTRLAQ